MKSVGKMFGLFGLAFIALCATEFSLLAISDTYLVDGPLGLTATSGLIAVICMGLFVAWPCYYMYGRQRMTTIPTPSFVTSPSETAPNPVTANFRRPHLKPWHINTLAVVVIMVILAISLRHFIHDWWSEAQFLIQSNRGNDWGSDMGKLAIIIISLAIMIVPIPMLSLGIILFLLGNRLWHKYIGIWAIALLFFALTGNAAIGGHHRHIQEAQEARQAATWIAEDKLTIERRLNASMQAFHQVKDETFMLYPSTSTQIGNSTLTLRSRTYNDAGNLPGEQIRTEDRWALSSEYTYSGSLAPWASTLPAKAMRKASYIRVSEMLVPERYYATEYTAYATGNHKCEFNSRCTFINAPIGVGECRADVDINVTCTIYTPTKHQLKLTTNDPSYDIAATKVALDNLVPTKSSNITLTYTEQDKRRLAQ